MDQLALTKTQQHEKLGTRHKCIGQVSEDKAPHAIRNRKKPALVCSKRPILFPWNDGVFQPATLTYLHELSPRVTPPELAAQDFELRRHQWTSEGHQKWWTGASADLSFLLSLPFLSLTGQWVQICLFWGMWGRSSIILENLV